MTRIFISVAVFVLIASIACAAPSDIVPQGSAANDWIAALAARGYLGPKIHPTDFTGEALHTRDQIGEILYAALVDDDLTAKVAKDPASCALAYQAVRFFRPELLARNADYDALVDALRPKSIGYVGTVQPEQRIQSGGDTGSGSFLTYRAVVGGELRSNLSYVVSASNWATDDRQPFYNDYGAKGFDPLNEAYLRYDGPNGLDIRAGRMNERWGPAMRGAELVSDNVPAYDELRVAFPFSLGHVLGHGWQYTQFASSYQGYAGKRYFEARRIEYAFSQRWNLQYEEAFDSSFTGSYWATPMPFLVFKGYNVNYTEPRYNFNSDLGLTYSVNPNNRVYGQYFIDDFRSPLGGHKFFGLSLGNSNSDTPRRIGFVVGGTHEHAGTSMTVEYAFADPTSNIFKNDNATWETAHYDFIGMPSGPNTSELSGRLSQKIGSKLTLSAQYRDRHRHDDSFPAPTSRYVGVFGDYNLSQRDTVGVSWNDYKEDPFPYQPGQAGYPAPQKYMPFSQADPGQFIRTRQVDLTYKYTF